MKNILIATDLKPETENALARAIQIAQSNNAKLYITHVLAMSNNPNFDHLIGERINERQGEIKKLIEKYKNNGELNYEIRILQDGRVQDQIDKTAREVEADIVILGADRSSAGGPSFIRSKAEHLVWESGYPVLIAVNAVTAPYQNTLLVGREYKGGFIDLLFKNRREKFKQKIINRIHKMLTNLDTIMDTQKYTFIEKNADLDLLTELKSRNCDLTVIRVELLDWKQPDFGEDIHNIIINEPCDIILMKR